jgi:hypothetical protein
MSVQPGLFARLRPKPLEVHRTRLLKNREIGDQKDPSKLDGSFFQR